MTVCCDPNKDSRTRARFCWYRTHAAWGTEEKGRNKVILAVRFIPKCHLAEIIIVRKKQILYWTKKGRWQ